MSPCKAVLYETTTEHTELDELRAHNAQLEAMVEALQARE